VDARLSGIMRTARRRLRGDARGRDGGVREELAAGVIHTYPDSPMDAADACGGPDGLAPARLASYLGHHLQQCIGSD
jgi:hypothetical protein